MPALTSAGILFMGFLVIFKGYIRYCFKFLTMLLYNITFNIEPEIHESWLDWIRTTYIPYVLETRHFTTYRIFRLLNETENQGITFSLQFFSPSLSDVEAYLEKYAPAIVARHNEVFKYKHVSFMTILEAVE